MRYQIDISKRLAQGLNSAAKLKRDVAGAISSAEAKTAGFVRDVRTGRVKIVATLDVKRVNKK